MGLRIQQLPPNIANQIAAGEVIERPASVVKELLENSMDAGATSIAIDIGYGGLNQIKISDNGIGIVADDLPLAVAAHATSKITTLNDLYAIDTMGFRGEALASIASIARLTISSKPAEQNHGMMLRIQSGEYTLSPCARADGTTIDVVDLFFNAPVRKRFLKSEQLEFQAIDAVVKRFALSAPHIALTLTHNKKQIFSLPAVQNDVAKLERLAKIFGRSFIKDALYLDVKQGTMALCGWISGPGIARSQNDRQWVYINQRIVKDKLIHHALKQAYDGLLHPGRFPACMLYLSMSTCDVDVNVHPTKHEVRFAQPRLIHDFITSNITKALAVKSFFPAHEESEYQTPAFKNPSLYLSEPIYSLPTVKGQKKDALINGGVLTPRHRHKRDLFDLGADAPWIILNAEHILVFLNNEPILVDVCRLQQEYLLNRLNQTDTPFDSRPLLVPVTIPCMLTVEPNALELLLLELGMHLDASHHGQIFIKSIPVMLPNLDIRMFVQMLKGYSIIRREDLLDMMARAHSTHPNSIPKDEQADMNHFLSHLVEHQELNGQVYKILSQDACRKILHV